MATGWRHVECGSAARTPQPAVVMSAYDPLLPLAYVRSSTRNRIDITPDKMLERHQFKESFDQTYLPAIIRQCRDILIEYPVREPKNGSWLAYARRDLFRGLLNCPESCPSFVRSWPTLGLFRRCQNSTSEPCQFRCQRSKRRPSPNRQKPGRIALSAGVI